MPSLRVGLLTLITFDNGSFERVIKAIDQGDNMPEETTQVASKPRRTFDSAYGFSFSVAVGLILFIAGLIISLTVGQGTSLGLIFGIPLLGAGLIIPLFMLRDLFVTAEVKEPCPNCGATIRTSDATLQLRCEACQKVINVRERRLYLGAE
jgi:hypothetical protein